MTRECHVRFCVEAGGETPPAYSPDVTALSPVASMKQVLRSLSTNAQRASAAVALPDYRDVPGHLGAWCVHRRDREAVTITTLSFWTDFGAIRQRGCTKLTADKR
jgi:hypothetical protein